MNWNLVGAPIEGSVLSFLKAEWKVSDTVLVMTTILNEWLNY